MSEHLIHMLSKIEYGRISKSKFMESTDGIIESLRKEFPLILPIRKQNSFRFEIKMEGAPEVITETDPMLTMLSPNKTWGIRIAPNFVILQTKKYEGFTNFKSKMISVIDAVEKHFEITHTSFIGMRYVNKYGYTAGKEFTDAFKRPEFLQPDLKGWSKAGSNLNARYVVGTDNISVNSGVLVDHSRYIPDIAELASDLDDITKVINGPAAHLDIDAFFNSEELIDFNKDFVISKIETLRNHANCVYFDTINRDNLKNVLKV